MRCLVEGIVAATVCAGISVSPVTAVDIQDERLAVRQAKEKRVQATSQTTGDVLQDTSGSEQESHVHTFAPLCDSACIQCESSWDPAAWSRTGKYWGLYQFDYSTWVAHGGLPEAYGSAGAAEQHRVASRIQYDAWPNC